MNAHMWIPKAIAQKAISGLGMLPLYHRAQQIGGRLKDFHPATRVEYAGKLAKDVGLERLAGAKVVEIGTGWVPVVPIGLHLLGVQSIDTFDLSKHLQPKLTMSALSKMRDCVPDLATRSGMSVGEIEPRLASLQKATDFAALVRMMNLTYHAPADFCDSGIADQCVDVVYSNLVLEHVEPRALAGILAESRRILKPGAVCWHNVDFTDHYSHTHRGLSHVNFLRYSESFWRRVGQNNILYQNRMRHSDYVRAFEHAGFKIVQEVRYDGGDTIDVPVSEQFRAYDKADLFCGAARFVLRKAAAA